MWQILTAQIKEDIYYSPISRELFLEELKGIYNGKRGTGDLLYIDKQILKEDNTRRKNLAIA